MSIRQNKPVWFVMAIAVVGLTTYGFSVHKNLRVVHARSTQSRIPLASSRAEQYVRMSRLEPRLRPALQALGDRTQKPGKERLSVIATEQVGSESRPVTIILEFPDRLRVEELGNGPRRVLTFDGSALRASTAALNESDRDLVETLVYDTAEHFFLTQVTGTATRLLGLRFRMDDGAAPNYTGPSYDLYDVSEIINTSDQPRVQTKRYLINSDTLLPERVQYSLQRDGLSVPVEIQLTDWQPTQGQRIARRIVRLENNQPVLTVTINAIALSPKIDDQIFR